MGTITREEIEGAGEIIIFRRCYWYRMSSIFLSIPFRQSLFFPFKSLLVGGEEEKRLSLVPPQWPFEVDHFFSFSSFFQ
jgi:hypothetical protein